MCCVFFHKAGPHGAILLQLNTFLSIFCPFFHEKIKLINISSGSKKRISAGYYCSLESKGGWYDRAQGTSSSVQKDAYKSLQPETFCSSENVTSPKFIASQHSARKDPPQPLSRPQATAETGNRNNALIMDRHCTRPALALLLS